MKKFKRKVLAMLMTNNFGSSLRQQLFDGAPFRSSLLYTAIPQRAASGTTGTFTRATTKTVENNDGYLVTLLAGEIGFPGARRVRNLVTKSEDLTSGWAANNAGSVTATTITFTAASNDGWNVTGLTVEAGRTYLWSALMSATSGTKNVRFRCGGGALSSNIGLTTTPTRVSAVFTAVTAGATNGIYNESGGGAATVNCTEMQLEDITGRTDQTTPSEYVSVGVESAPYYHGSFVDGVKCFPTDLSGNPIPSTTMLGYSAEGARENLCLQSQTFDNASWTLYANSSITANQAVAPDGTTTADLLYPTITAAPVGIYQQITLAAATATTSVYAKAAGFSWFRIVGDSGSSATGVWFNLASGNVGTATSGYVGTIEDAGNGWYRCSVAHPSQANPYFELRLADADTSNNATASGTNGIYLWGAQIESAISFAGSYIATTTIAVARNADVESVSTSGNIAAAAGSVYLEYTPTHTPSGTIALWGTYVDASNYTAILHDATNLIFRKRIAGVNYDATIANSFVSGTTYKACATWGASGTSITLNGTEGTPHANTTAAQIAATMQWGADGNSLQQPFASIRNCRDWLRQLSASERAAITS